jgi:hypothetical protein
VSTASKKTLLAEAGYQNIQVLKGVPYSQVSPIMSLMSASLGVSCGYCHDVKDYHKDDKGPKDIARQMIRMVFHINKTNFKGRSEVTCYTCHRGEARPAPLAPFRQTVGEIRPAVPPTPLPSADQIVQRYLHAIGGRAAFDRFKTCQIRFSRPSGTGQPEVPAEIYDAGREGVYITSPRYGSAADRLANGLFRARLEPSVAQQYEHLTRPVQFLERHAGLRVAGRVRIGDGDAYEVTAQAGGKSVHLFFDIRTGLLVRRVAPLHETVLGVVLEQMDFEDYRDVDGVKLPFLTRRSSIRGSSILRLSEIRHNVAAGPTEKK